MNARRAPQHILNAHLTNQCPQFCANWRSASWIAGLPVPVATKSSTMPAHDRLGPDDRNGLENRREHSIQHDEEQAIAVRQLDAPADLSLQHDQLVSKRGVLRLKSTCRLERPPKQ